MSVIQQARLMMLEHEREMLTGLIRKLAPHRKNRIVTYALQEVNVAIREARAGTLDGESFGKIMYGALEIEQQADSILKADLYLDVEVTESAWELWKRDRRWFDAVLEKVKGSVDAKRLFVVYAEYILNTYYPGWEA